VKVLLTGGAGYVGGALTDLLAGTHDLRVYDRLLYEDSYRKPVDFAFGDVRDVERLQPHLDWADVVVWLAALVGDGACALNPEVTVEVNEQSVRWLAEHYRGRIIFMSTCSVYGACDGMLDERSPTNPLSLYAQTKLRAEAALADASADALCLRFGTLFGVGDAFSRVRMDLVLNAMAAKAAVRGRITVFGGSQHRPLLHVKDAARSIALAIDSRERGIFNVHAVNLSIGQLAERLREHFPDLDVQQTGTASQDKRDYRVTSAKAETRLGFHPQYTVDEGITEIAVLVRQGRVKDIYHAGYDNVRSLRPLVSTNASPIGYEVARYR
jgi:nucleoside-diphosphate-sugar epimerase